METINFIAEMWGFGFAIASLAMIFNQNLIKKFFDFAEEDLPVFFHGILSFLVGLATVLNIAWAGNWKVIIAIFGWLAILKGIMLLFAPEASKKITSKFENKSWLSYALLVVLILGLALIYLGFQK